MNNIQDKYRKQIKTLFLFSYLCFLIIGLFHIHKFEINSGYVFSSSHNKEHGTTDVFGDRSNSCHFVYVTNSIHNLHYACQISETILPVDTIISLLNIHQKITSDYIQFKSSRAPPQISFC